MADSTRFVVAVVDDDHRTLESLADLLEAAGYDVRLYSSATVLCEQLLAAIGTALGASRRKGEA